MTKSLRALTLCAALMATLCVLGCSGQPSGFPKVSPCTITVTDGSNPIEGVEIALIPSTPISGVIVGGVTDSSGVCVVKTTFANFAKPGAPQGDFTVTLRKDPIPTKPELTIAEMESMSRADIDKYNKERDDEIKSMPQIIPTNLTSKPTSKVQLTMPGTSDLSVDVSQYR